MATNVMPIPTPPRRHRVVVLPRPATDPLVAEARAHERRLFNAWLASLREYPDWPEYQDSLERAWRTALSREQRRVDRSPGPATPATWRPDEGRRSGGDPGAGDRLDRFNDWWERHEAPLSLGLVALALAVAVLRVTGRW